ncbi:hypothetical protein [Bacillus mobilis]|uniref:hypothetical protein n=1 Tax=Bacillus mobilis TaxID=2026190 RepID=UPI0036994718
MENVGLHLCLTIEKETTLEEVEKILVELGFKQQFNNSHWYKWFDKYQSTEGCIFGMTSRKDTNNEYEFFFKASTYLGRSYADVEMQNKVIREIREKFGGVLCDENGLQTSFIENTLPQLTSTEIVCEIEYRRFLNNVARFNILIEEKDEKFLEDYRVMEDPGMREFISSALSYNTSLLRNNTLIPFAVATLEDFLKNFLIKNLETNEKARDIIFQNDRKIKYSEIKEILLGEKSLVEMEMEFYNFQNLESANNAYKKFLNFDIFKKVLQEEIPLENEKVTVLSILIELIAIRHSVIHEAKLDYTLGKTKMEQYYTCLQFFGTTFMDKFRGEFGLRDTFKELNVKMVRN